MTWSFSRLKSFYNCPYEWKKVYIDWSKGEDGFFSEYGRFCHSIFEKFEKGELSSVELADYYVENFPLEVVHKAPPNKYVDIRQSFYDKGLEYFKNFTFNLSAYNQLGAEKKVLFKVGEYKFIGFIDLLLETKNKGEIVILDHKSATLHFKKNGEIYKSDEELFMEFKRQLYLYSIPIIEEYGHVEYLVWNMFKQGKIIRIPWKEEEYKEAIDWALETIHLIEKEENWYPNPELFYCNYMCGQRNKSCPYKP